MTVWIQLGLWALFLLGTALHLLKRMGFAVRNPLNPIHSRRAYLAYYWDVISVRTALETIGFWAWLRDPAVASHLPNALGLDVHVILPVTAANCFVLGFFGDSILDWLIQQFPRLREQIPMLKDTAQDKAPE